MKSKALTYVMLVVVGIIWYQVFFRVKNNLLGEDDTIPNPNQSFEQVNAMARDTVDLQVNYRDPFRYEKMTTNLPLLSESPKPPANPRAAMNRNPKPQFAWPNISYHGLIRNRKSSKPLALIRVDGLVYNLRLGDEIFNSIYIKSIEPEMLTIKYKKLEKTVERK
ncbi:MAG: hypothetical protein NXI10_05680 [bacterium]|nr:hypothetical protein [bacterium]